MKKQKVAYNAVNVYRIDPDFFIQIGVKNVVFDLDNTLASAFDETPSEECKNLVSELKGMGLRVIIISNNGPDRVEKFVKDLDVEYLSSAFKYVPRRIKKYLKVNNVDVDDTIFIGDQILSDRTYVKKLKGRMILTEPLVPRDNWITKIPRFIDRRIRKRWRKNQQLGTQCPYRTELEDN